MSHEMSYNPDLFVEVHTFEGERPPHPNPVEEGGFSSNFIYRVLGIYNPSETSECYFMLSNPQRQIWFIPQRHLRAYALVPGDELFLPKPVSSRARTRLVSTLPGTAT